MDGNSLSTPQDQPVPLPNVSDAERERNKQLVLDFFHNVGDVNDWSDQNVDKYIAPDFINHSRVEPSTARAYAAFMRKLMAGVIRKPRQADRTSLPLDSKGRPIQYLFADGDIVVNIRDLNWPMDDGSLYRTYMGDVFRIKGDRIAEMWCVCAPMPQRKENKVAGQ